MNVLLLVLYIAFTSAISVINAYQVGMYWTESKIMGGTALRLLLWCGAVMAWVGFTYVMVITAGSVGYAANWLDLEQVEFLFNLGLVLVIFPLLGSGLGIGIHSWVRLWRKRNLGNALIAGYNTAAQLNNMWVAAKGVPTALEEIGEFLSDALSSSGGGKDKGKALGALLLILLVIFLALLSAFLTMGIIQYADRRHVLDANTQMEA
jgi:hypothetical protein